MRARSLAALVALLLAMAVSLRSASADVKADIGTKIRAAMKAYDAFEYDSARKLLAQAIAMARKGKLEADPFLAKAYLDLGIVLYALEDVEGAKTAFKSAIQIDSNVELEVAYKSPDLTKLLDSVRPRTADEPLIRSNSSKPPPNAECASITGIEHALIHAATAGEPQPIDVRVTAGVSRVSVMYRIDGATAFVELPLKRQRDCNYAGVLPGAAVQGKLLYYYIAAFANGPAPVATKGSADLPNIVAISAPAAEAAEAATAVSKSQAASGSAKPTILVAIAGGSGIGYVRGTTEGQNAVKRCCFGTSLLVATGEVSYFATPQLLIGGVFRMGIPVGANLEGHSKTAPAGLVRMRYAFSPSGDGLHVLGQIGFGFLRHAVKVDNPEPGMDTDVLAQGPLLVGGGIGATLHLTRSLALFADVSVLGGLAVVNHLGNSVLNSGVAGDLTLGMAAIL